MRLTRLHCENFRNLADVTVQLDDSVNLFYGENGSGKTSLLETLYFLSTGRSFRGNRLNPIKQRGKDFTLVSAELDSPSEGLVNIGVRRDETEKTIRLNGQPESRQSELARFLPILVLGPDTVDLIKGAPDERRKFLNQGMFHVEHSFNDLWRVGIRALQQRNSLLRQDSVLPSEIAPWTEQFAHACQKIHDLRSHYFDRFLPVFTDTYRFLLDLEGVKCSYQRGWDSSRSIQEVLEDQNESDQIRKFTQSGFQRADLRFTCNGVPVSQVCSRGELKLLSWAAVLAQGFVLSEASQKPIFLVDDLIAELDHKHQRAVSQLVQKQGGQVLVTGTDRQLLEALWDKDCGKLFHVEHGSVNELEKTE